MAYANRHPMQLLTPPENVQLSELKVNVHCHIGTSCVTVQVPVHPNG